MNQDFGAVADDQRRDHRRFAVTKESDVPDNRGVEDCLDKSPVLAPALWVTAKSGDGSGHVREVKVVLSLDECLLGLSSPRMGCSGSTGQPWSG